MLGNIVHISYADSGGGASIAVHRLNHAMCNANLKSYILVEKNIGLSIKLNRILPKSICDVFPCVCNNFIQLFIWIIQRKNFKNINHLANGVEELVLTIWLMIHQSKKQMWFIFIGWIIEHCLSKRLDVC